MAKTNNAPDRPICVATVFGRDEVEVTRSFLRAYGIITLEGLAESYRDERWPRGVGASPILVPASQAQDAIDLLRSTENDRVDDHETSDNGRGNQDSETEGRRFFARWWRLLTAPFRSPKDAVRYERKRIIHDLPADFHHGGEV